VQSFLFSLSATLQTPSKSPAPTKSKRSSSKARASSDAASTWAKDNVKPKVTAWKDVLGSIFLMTVPPFFVHILTFTLRDKTIDGSWFKLVEFLGKQDIASSFGKMLPTWAEIQNGGYYVVMFGMIQLLLMWLVPGV